MIVTLPKALARAGQRVLGSALSSIPYFVSLIYMLETVDGLTFASHRRLNSMILGVRMILGTPFHPCTTSGSFYLSVPV
jgi:hypothetical protein